MPRVAKKNAKPVEAMPDESYAFIPNLITPEEKLVRRRGDKMRFIRDCTRDAWLALVSINASVTQETVERLASNAAKIHEMSEKLANE